MPAAVRLTALLLAVLALAPLVPLAAAEEVPYLTGRVNDYAEMIPAEVETRLEERLARLEEETGAQVAVLTIGSLGGEEIEGYALRVAETWGLGREEVDDGALLLVARDDRKMRLEVGYGLEPVLSDIVSKRILDDVVRPRFRAGDFGGGIEAGVEAIDGTVRGQDVLPPPAERAAGGIEEVPWPARIGGFVFFLFVVGIFSLSALFTKGCGAWFLYLFLIPFWAAFPMALLGPVPGGALLLVWLIGFPVLWTLLHKTAGGRHFSTSHPWIGSFGSRGGGWSSSGGFGGGGFSGGGGSFGGGGASSSW